jgi:hypothetical protein
LTTASRLVLGEQRRDQREVADVALDEHVRASPSRLARLSRLPA